MYNNEMELARPSTDFMAGHPTSVVALADDLAPTVMDSGTRDVLHKMQLLLNIVESHGNQLHMEFGDNKCKLLITARNKKLKEVETLLSEEPNLLTFYGKPELCLSTGWPRDRTCPTCCSTQPRMQCLV